MATDKQLILNYRTGLYIAWKIAKGYIDGLKYMLDTADKEARIERNKILDLDKAGINATRKIHEMLAREGRTENAGKQAQVFTDLIYDLSLMDEVDYKRIKNLIDKIKDGKSKTEAATA